MGQRTLVVTGRDQSRAEHLVSQLTANKLNPVSFQVEGEPTVEIVQAGLKQARVAKCDVVVSIGGGSAIDAGKAIAALLTNPGDPLHYLEVIGRGHPLKKEPAPYIAVPTTAGTGSEVTRNAVLTSIEHKVKVSMRSPMMLPSLALVDPQLTFTMPPEVTASTGLDALTQLMEPFVSSKANPLTDAICREGMQRAARSLSRAFQYSRDPAAREDMSLASLFGGLALANAKLGAAHGFAGPIGGMFPTAPHGVICARMLPHVMQTNIQALKDRDPQNPALQRYDEIAKIVNGDQGAVAVHGIVWIDKLCQELSVTPLFAYGLTEADFP
jgi:alcohol dehydrogenase class IV